MDGEVVGAPGPAVVFPHTGGWSSKADDWRELYLAAGGKALVLSLQPGTHTLMLRNETQGGLNLDWIRLVPLR